MNYGSHHNIAGDSVLTRLQKFLQYRQFEIYTMNGTIQKISKCQGFRKTIGHTSMYGMYSRRIFFKVSEPVCRSKATILK